VEKLASMPSRRVIATHAVPEGGQVSSAPEKAGVYHHGHGVDRINVSGSSLQDDGRDDSVARSAFAGDEASGQREGQSPPLSTADAGGPMGQKTTQNDGTTADDIEAEESEVNPISIIEDPASQIKRVPAEVRVSISRKNIQESQKPTQKNGCFEVCQRIVRTLTEALESMGDRIPAIATHESFVFIRDTIIPSLDFISLSLKRARHEELTPEMLRQSADMYDHSAQELKRQFESFPEAQNIRAVHVIGQSVQARALQCWQVHTGQGQ